MTRTATLIAVSLLTLIATQRHAIADMASMPAAEQPSGSAARMLQYAGYDDRHSEPRGSFDQSCRNIRVRDGWLHARCRTIDGDWVRSSIEFTNCRRNAVANHDGRLVCGPR